MKIENSDWHSSCSCRLVYLAEVFFSLCLFIIHTVPIYARNLLTSIILPVYQSACRAVAEHCRKKGKSITKLAMQYSLMNNEISTVLVGMNSSEQVHCFFGLLPSIQRIHIIA